MFGIATIVAVLSCDDLEAMAKQFFGFLTHQVTDRGGPDFTV